jgi:NADH-quinone oxidoreductase subunit J
VNLTTVVFYIFAGWAVLSALLCITRRNAIASALWLVSAMFALAAIFVLLNAQFIAAIQVLVYAGAVMVLFLFVIMLINADSAPRNWKAAPMWVVGIGLGGVMAAQLVSLGGYDKSRIANEISTMPNPDPALVLPEAISMQVAIDSLGVVGAIAEPLFRAYLIPFEITSVLLLAAIIGAVVLAKKKI